MRLVIYLSKAKARPVGSVSPNGKYKKASSGKWLPIKKERAAKVGLEMTVKDSYNWILRETNNYFEAAVLVDESGKVLKKRLGEKTKVDLSDMVYAMQGNILLHNHPSGSAFSPDDVMCALTNDLKEIRAFGKEYEYIYRPEKAIPKTPANIYIRRSVIDFLSDQNMAMYDKQEPKVKAGEMSIKAATLNHWHEVMTNFVAKFGGVYERRKSQVG